MPATLQPFASPEAKGCSRQAARVLTRFHRSPINEAMSPPATAAPRASFRGAGRKLEKFVWQFRSYLIPAHVAAYWSIVRTHRFTPGDAGRRIVCFDFTRVDIDASTGRYVFALVRDFEALDYLICYRRNFRFLATMRHKIHKRRLLERPFRVCGSLAELPGASLVAVVSDRHPFPESAAPRPIRVRYEERWPESDCEVPMSFFVHPFLHEHCLSAPPPDLLASRPWRVFFSGAATDRRYGTSVLPAKFGKMSRGGILETLESALPAGQLRRVRTAADLGQIDPQIPSFVWVGGGDYRIPQTEWLDALNRSDFFLACPGVEMPLCHNLIEAMSRAAVPILEHPEFLEPRLKDGVNCLVFHGREQLMATMERALRMAPDEIVRLRRGAHAYYLEYLAPGRFARRLLDHPCPRIDLLLNAYRTPRPGDIPAFPAAARR
jgi:hypothetical protein